MECEDLAIKWAIAQLRYYILGHKFTLVTYHAPLQWMALHKSRTHEVLLEPKFLDIYCRGVLQANVDALSWGLQPLGQLDIFKNPKLSIQKWSDASRSVSFILPRKMRRNERRSTKRTVNVRASSEDEIRRPFILGLLILNLHVWSITVSSHPGGRVSLTCPLTCLTVYNDVRMWYRQRAWPASRAHAEEIHGLSHVDCVCYDTLLDRRRRSKLKQILSKISNGR
ncbi:uncharacterized protein LOC120516084 [Polypterus senegalus]|uniref:uncharacterized protein LOC120516084 n=1 Tax=Polypterus senegalus TaxID=55291 RepID=UPI0019667EB9|nr:uncharacterized protein LOC120516084 [Polypterus senegalus]